MGGATEYTGLGGVQDVQNGVVLFGGRNVPRLVGRLGAGEV